MKHKVAIIIGTRPDVIKQWSPYISLKRKDCIETILIHSGQHDSLGIQAQQTFKLIPDHTCKVLDDDKFRLGDLVSRLISEFTSSLYTFNPELILVHGDTSTAFAAATAAFLQNIPVGHVEAGLRTSRFEYPFPEEGYRRAISRFTTLHFAPTNRSAQNLREEGINQGIYVTGNTVVDSLYHILKIGDYSNKWIYRWTDDFRFPLVLITCHRRESYGEPLREFCNTIKNLVQDEPDVRFIWPVHSNPKINDTVINTLAGVGKNIALIPPLDYNAFVSLLNNASLVITDSGGVMEEATVLGKPTLVLRDETERPECLDLDTVQLVGYDFEALSSITKEWLNSPPEQKANNIFGDGTSGEEIADIVEQYLCQPQKKS